MLANELPPDFVAGRIFEFSAGAAPTYMWGTGVILMGLSLLIVSLDSEDRDWIRASALLGVAFAAMGLTDMGLFGTQDIAWIVTLATMTTIFYWLLKVPRVTSIERTSDTSDLNLTDRTPPDNVAERASHHHALISIWIDRSPHERRGAISGGCAECALLRQNGFDWCFGEVSCCTGGEHDRDIGT